MAANTTSPRYQALLSESLVSEFVMRENIADGNTIAGRFHHAFLANDEFEKYIEMKLAGGCNASKAMTQHMVHLIGGRPFCAWPAGATKKELSAVP